MNKESATTCLVAFALFAVVLAVATQSPDKDRPPSKRPQPREEVVPPEARGAPRGEAAPQKKPSVYYSEYFSVMHLAADQGRPALIVISDEPHPIVHDHDPELVVGWLEPDKPAGMYEPRTNRDLFETFDIPCALFVPSIAVGAKRFSFVELDYANLRKDLAEHWR